MRIVRCYRPQSNGSLEAIVDIETQSGLKIKGFKVFHGQNGHFVIWPDRPRIREGSVVIEDGRWVTDNVVWVEDEGRRKQFEGALLDAYHAYSDSEGEGGGGGYSQGGYNNQSRPSRQSNQQGNRRPPQGGGGGSRDQGQGRAHRQAPPQSGGGGGGWGGF